MRLADALWAVVTVCLERELVYVVAVYNTKGGVGKSTTAVNLAAALAEKGRRVLVVDLDPQASASQTLGIRDDGRALGEGISGREALPIRRTSTAGVDIVPSGLALGGVEKALARELGAEVVVRNKLAGLDGYDLVILDAPPGLGMLAIGALVAAHGVLVPVTPNPLSLGGLAGMLQAFETIRERLNPPLDLMGMLLTIVDRRTALAKEVEADLRRRFGGKVLTTVIRQTVKLAEAAGHGCPVLAYAPDSTGSADYRDLAGELLARMEQPVRKAMTA